LESSLQSGGNENPADSGGVLSKSAFLAGLFTGLLGLLLPRALAGLLLLLTRLVALPALLRLALIALPALLRLALVVLVHENLQSKI
jgi:hypothetical protein